MVWKQHDRYFRAQGEEIDPLEMFDYDLLLGGVEMEKKSS